MLKELIKLANELDSRGLAKEADALDEIIIEAQSWSDQLIERTLSKPRNLARKALDGVSDALPRREEDPMDIARKQEQEARTNKMKENLKATKDWFTENIFVSKADKFPVFADRDLYIGYEHSPFGGPEAMIFPTGTEFDSLEQNKPLKGGGQMNLRRAWDYLKGYLKRLEGK